MVYDECVVESVEVESHFRLLWIIFTAYISETKKLLEARKRS